MSKSLSIRFVVIVTVVAAAQHAFAQQVQRVDLNNAASEQEVQATIREIESRTAAARRVAEQTSQAQASVIRNYQSISGSLSARRTPLASQTEFMNTVTSFRTRSELDQQVEVLREKWNAKYGPRIGIVNPYEGTSYYRYYDEKDGQLMVTKVQGDYELLKRQRDDWQTSFQRAKETRDAAEQAYAAYSKNYGEYQAMQSELASAKVAAEQRLSQFAAANAERERQRIAAEVERRRGNLYDIEKDPPIFENGSSRSNQFPRNVGGRLVSP